MSEDTQPGELDLDEVRAHAQAIVERTKADAGFRDRLKADPEGALKEAGIDERAIGDFSRELSEDGEVQAHRLPPDNPCVPFTCSISCIVTYAF
jgi:hypothetical protein